MRQLTAILSSLLLLAGCAAKPGQNVYKEGELGVSRAIEYGTIVGVSEVEVEPKNTGIGTLAGAGVGAGAGSYVGGGSGNAWATAGAAVAGAVIGTIAERELNRTTGYKYTIRMQNGETKSIVERTDEGNQVFAKGQKVSIEYCDGGNEYNRRCASGATFQRLEAVDSFPPYTKTKRKVVKG